MSGHVRTSDVTYVKDVAPILERRCAGCHVTGGFAGVPLDSYEQAREHAREIRDEVLERRMPPWPAAPGFGDFRNDRSLSPAEIDVLAAWSTNGAPIGIAAPAAPVTPLTPPEHQGATVNLPEAHPARGRTERLDVPFAFTSRQWITGWEYRPGDPEVQQHAEFFVDGVRIGAWAPSQGAVAYLEGVTVPVRRGSRVAAELGYRKSDMAAVPGGRLTLYFGARGGTAPQRLVLACGTNTIRRNVRALAITPYAPGDGDSVEVVARYGDGRIEPLSVVPRYRPDFALTYDFRVPVPLAGGTIVDVRSSAPGCSATLDVIAAAATRGAGRGR